MNGTLYAILEVVVFMIAATAFGFLVGRSTRRPAVASDPELEHRLATAMDAIREQEQERLALEAALAASQEEATQAREDATEAERSAAEHSEAVEGEENPELVELRAEVERASANASRLEAEVERRNSRIQQLEAARAEQGDAPLPEARPVGGFSSSAGSFADTQIVFSEEDAES